MCATLLRPNLYIHLYSHKLQLQKQEIKKKQRKMKDTQRVNERNVSNAY